MSTARKTYSIPQNTALLSQVDSLCPLCDVRLFYNKNGRSQKKYELAHIYPLNPSPEEIKLLKNEEILNSDVNHEDNIIPLCLTCHKKFDTPRTVEEYRQLVKIKKDLIQRDLQKDLMSEYPIEESLSFIVEKLCSHDTDNANNPITDPKEVENKLNNTIDFSTKTQIKNNVREYFYFVKNKFKEMDKIFPGQPESISAQVRAYYIKQKSLSTSQQEIYKNIALWIMKRTNASNNHSVDIITAFFIQNCEVFE